VSTGKQQPLQRYNKPVLVTALNDNSSPYSFTDWYSAHQFITPGQEYNLYNDYLTNWFKNKSSQPSSTSAQLQLNYLALLKQLQLFFSKEETENWYNNVDVTNEKELLLSIPYFAKKLKEISLYYLQLRKTIKETRLNYKQIGTNFGITQQVQNYLLNNYTQKPNSVVTLPATIWNNIPALSAVNGSINVEIEELYDAHNYFDQSPTLPVSAYYDTNNAELQRFLTTKNLTLTSTNWIYNLGVYSLSTNPYIQTSVLSADPAFQNTIANSIETLSKQLTETYIGQNKYSTTYNVNQEQDFYNISIQPGNNTFYWPNAAYASETSNYPYYQPIALTDMGLETLATGGSSIDTADTIFVKTSRGVQGAWLYNQVYNYSNPTMQALFRSGEKTAFIYPYPGYGLSADDISWTGLGLTYNPQFNYLEDSVKQSILNAYWNANVALTSTTVALNINDTNLIDSNAFPSTVYSNADQIKVQTTPLPYNDESNFIDSTDGAWLYKFTQTDISVAPNGGSTILWPFEKVNPSNDLPTYYPTNLTNFCEPVLVNPITITGNNNLSGISTVLNVPYAIAGTTLSSADVIYKITNYQDTSATAIQCCWLSGSVITTTPQGVLNVGVNSSGQVVTTTSSYFQISAVQQTSLQGIFQSGTYTRFIWNGPDLTDVNTIFKTINHQPDCNYVTTPNTTYKDYGLCTCNAVMFSPFGQPGNLPTDYSSLNDFIIQDTSAPGNLDLTTWKDSSNYPYTNSYGFMWYNTNNVVGWGDGQWVTTATGDYFNTKLRTGTAYIYYRADVKYKNNQTVVLPEYVLRYTSPSLSATTVWVQAYQDQNGNWQNGGKPSQMVINPGDILLYSRTGSTNYNLVGYNTVPQDISLNVISIWSNYDYMSVGNNSVNLPKSFTLNWPSITPTTGNNSKTLNQLPTNPKDNNPVTYDQLSSVSWQIADITNNGKILTFNTPSLNITPDPTITQTTLYAVTAFYQLKPSAGGSGSVSSWSTGIPYLTAIPSTVSVPSLTSYNTPVPGFVINTPLQGWNYNTSTYSKSYDAFTTNLGARPYWGKLYNQKDQNTGYKGIESNGTPLRLVDSYNIVTQPEISDIQFISGIYLEYANNNTYDLYWNQPVSLAAYVNSNVWNTLYYSTSTQSNLSYQLNNINTELVVTPTTAVSDLTIQNFVDNEPVQIFYNAVNNFTWNISATPVETKTVFSNTSTSNVLPSLYPWANISNQIYPSVAAFPAFEDLYSASDSGAYFIPDNLGISVYIDQDYTTNLNITAAGLVGYFEDATKTVGARGFSKTDSQTPYTIELENNIWLKENSLSNSIAGNIKKDVFKKYQKFLPYQSSYDTNPNNKLGIVLPDSRQTPWGGYQDSQWTDIANEPTSFTGTYNVSAWTGSQLLKQNGLQLDNWVTDIFGNQYGLYKNIENISPVLRKNLPGQIWTRNSLQFVSPGYISLSSVFNTYTGTSIINDLTGGNVRKIDTFFDVLYVETSGCVLFDKLNYDYNYGIISSTPDVSRAISLVLPVTTNLNREINKINLTGSTLATVGETWFFPNKNLVIISVCGLSSTVLTPELYSYDIKTYNLKKVFPLNQNDILTISSLSSVNLTAIDSPVLSYNELNSEYLLAVLGKDNNNNDNLIEIVINGYLPAPAINSITVYSANSITPIVDPPTILQPLTVTLSTNSPFSYTYIPNTAASTFKTVTTPTWVNFTPTAIAYNSYSGTFNGTTPALTGTYYAPFYVSNNIGPAYYTLTINVTSQ
jgi:hypothetical protein